MTSLLYSASTSSYCKEKCNLQKRHLAVPPEYMPPSSLVEAAGACVLWVVLRRGLDHSSYLIPQRLLRISNNTCAVDRWHQCQCGLVCHIVSASSISFQRHIRVLCHATVCA